MEPSIFDPADLRCMLPGEHSEEDVVGTERWLERHMVWGFAAFWAVMTFAILAFYWVKV